MDGGGRLTEPDAVGKYLFGEVKENLRKHIHLREEWQYSISSLFVMQSYVASVLPACFYLMITGKYGAAKTKFLKRIVALSGGILFENVSVAALARAMGEKPGRMVGIDEYDVTRERDVQEVRDALVRQGYQADCAPYTRYDAVKRQVEQIPIYGPKALTFRGSVEDALQSRGYIVEVAPYDGDDGFRYVKRNLVPRNDGIPEKMAQWGEVTRASLDSGQVEARMETEGYDERVKAAVQVFGANRESELGAMAVLVADLIGMESAVDLQDASKARGIAVAMSEDEDLEVLRDCLLGLAKGTVQAAIDSGGSITRVAHKDLRAAFDEARKARGDRRLTNSAFSSLRRELGIRDAWIRRPSNLVMYCLPTPYLTNLTYLTSTPYGENVRMVSMVRMDVPVGAVRTEKRPRLVDDQDAEEMTEFIDGIRFALSHNPELSDADHAAEIGRQLGLDPEDVRGRVTAVRQQLVDGKA